MTKLTRENLSVPMPNKLRLSHDGQLTMEDGSSVDEYLSSFHPDVATGKETIPVVLMSRDLAERLRTAALCYMLTGA